MGNENQSDLRIGLYILCVYRISCLKSFSICDGSDLICVVFWLASARNGLKQDSVKFDYAELLEDDDYKEASREERVYRTWINSLGIETFVTSLFEDVRDGYVELFGFHALKCMLGVYSTISLLENRAKVHKESSASSCLLCIQKVFPQMFLLPL